MWTTVIGGLVGGLLSGSFLAAIVTMATRRRGEIIAAEVRRQFEQELLRYRSSRQWKEQALSDLLAPLAMQLARTERAFNRWDGRNLFLEGKIIAEGNRTIRDLLLSKGHLIPPDLAGD